MKVAGQVLIAIGTVIAVAGWGIAMWNVFQDQTNAWEKFMALTAMACVTLYLLVAGLQWAINP